MLKYSSWEWGVKVKSSNTMNNKKRWQWMQCTQPASALISHSNSLSWALRGVRPEIPWRLWPTLRHHQQAAAAAHTRSHNPSLFPWQPPLPSPRDAWLLFRIDCHTQAQAWLQSSQCISWKQQSRTSRFLNRSRLPTFILRQLLRFQLRVNWPST